MSWVVTWCYLKAFIINRNTIKLYTFHGKEGSSFLESSCIIWNGKWQLPDSMPGSEGLLGHHFNSFLLFLCWMEITISVVVIVKVKKNIKGKYFLKLWGKTKASTFASLLLLWWDFLCNICKDSVLGIWKRDILHID